MPPFAALVAALVSGAGSGPAKVHAEDAAAHVGVVPVLERRAFAASRAAGDAVSFSRTVYGYYPYWADAAMMIPWQHLTHLAYFSVEVNVDGSLGSSHGWDGAGGSAIVSEGHANGVQVTLTATLFDDAQIGTLLNSASARQALIGNLLTLVSAHDGDGVNIDFEMVPASAKQNFVTFITDLSAAFHTDLPGSHVSIATPAVDWTGAFDYDLLAQNCDGLMIIGYGYHWSGGDPGPISPISGGTTWGGTDLRWTVEDYMTWGGVDNRHKFVLGFPLYGRDWPTVSDAVPGTAQAAGEARILTGCESAFAVGKQWDEDSQTPYRVYQDAGWRQLFCEDDASLAAKLDLVEETDLGGVMFWAIGYAREDAALWSDIDARFKVTQSNSPPIARAVGERVVDFGTTVTLDASSSSDPDGDALSFAWQVIEGGPVELQDTDAALASGVPQAAGEYLFRVSVSDGNASATADVSVTVLAAGAPKHPPDDSCADCAAAGPGLPALLALLLLRRRPRRRHRRRR